MRNYLKRFFVLLTALTPLSASAHVKWFAESNNTARAYRLTDLPVLAWIVITIAIVRVGIYLEKCLHLPDRLLAQLKGWQEAIFSIATFGLGLSLLLFSFQGFIFAPNLPATGGFETFLLILQGTAGVMLTFGLLSRLGGLAVILLFVLSIASYGIVEIADASEILGFGIFAFLVGRPRWKVFDIRWFGKITANFQEYAIPVLRVITGINLMILGFSEKILAPSLTQEFLGHYNWNFMSTLGITGFSDYWFAFSAGVVEFLFGLFLALGLVTRITTFTLALFLVTTLILLGPLELLGHLPHFAIAIVLLTLGAGEKLKLKVT